MKHSFVVALGLIASFFAAAGARADFVYQLDSPPLSRFVFNNSVGDEAESNFVANSFQVQAGGDRLTSITFYEGFPGLTNQSVTAAIYRGSSLTNPGAGGGLTLIATTTTTLTTTDRTFVTINLETPVDLAIGQIFYAALLLPDLPANIFPFTTDNHQPLGRSFFDIGPTQGAPYDLNNTSNLTVLGGNHPVVGQVQFPGNLVLRVNAEASPVPEPASLTLLGIGLASVVGYACRRQRKPSASAQESLAPGPSFHRP